MPIAAEGSAPQSGRPRTASSTGSDTGSQSTDRAIPTLASQDSHQCTQVLHTQNNRGSIAAGRRRAQATILYQPPRRHASQTKVAPGYTTVIATEELRITCARLA